MDHEDVHLENHMEYTRKPSRGGRLHWRTPTAPPISCTWRNKC